MEIDMTDNTQPEALRLALSIDLMDTFTNYQQEELDKAAAELRRQHTRIAELEAQLDSIGAGGASGPLIDRAADHFEDKLDMVARWYMVDKDGMATLCTDREDAEQEAKDANLAWPHTAPHRAVQLVEVGTSAAELQAPRPPAQAQEPAHADDAAVDALAEAMKAKLAKQRARGYGGWDTPEFTQQRLSDMLRGHVDKGDPVDVANFCAFLAARGEGIAQAAPAAVAVPSKAVAYLDIGSGGYLDIGTDLDDEELLKLPSGRHMLAIVGTFGVDGYTPAAAPTTQAAPQPAPIFGDEDHVLVPRGLLGAACSAIEKKRDGVKTLAELRRYTTGDLSKAAPQQEAQEPVAWQGVHDQTDLYYTKPAQADVRPLYTTTQPAPAAQGDALSWLQANDMAALERFAETTDDDESYDIGKEAVQRLAGFGCLWSHGFGKYSITDFGHYVLNDWSLARELPFKSQSERDAARLEIDSLQAGVQELGAMLRENRSKRIVELEAQLEAIGAGGVEPLRRDHFRDATEMVPVGWAISYDGKNPHALWTEGEGDLLDLEVKRQGGTACKMQLYARAEK